MKLLDLRKKKAPIEQCDYALDRIFTLEYIINLNGSVVFTLGRLKGFAWRLKEKNKPSKERMKFLLQEGMLETRWIERLQRQKVEMLRALEM